MKCPNCEEILVMTERQGVEIDYCPKCRGVWLDKGELDKIIEKSASTDSNQQLQQQQENRKRYDDDDDDDGGFFNKNRGYDNNANHKKRKGGFLGELFDF
jgi:Zn-finger nucleic acid-binding protein